MIGGALAKPVENLPSVFVPGSLWDRFPYLLPNLFSAVCVFVGVVIGVLFLEETHAEKKMRRDRGVELGNLLLSYLTPRNREDELPPAKSDEERPLLFESDEPLPGYLTDGNPLRSVSPSETLVEDGLGLDGRSSKPEAKAVTKIFTKPVIIIIASYGVLAL